MNQKDPYQILGVDKKASDEDIKKAYRRLSKKYHPDLNRNDKEAESKFKEINAAYEILGDKQKRAQFDQFGSAAFTGQGGRGFEGFEGFDFGFGGPGAGFADIFETFFGATGTGRSRKKRSYRGQDLEIQLTIDFKEAVFGVDKTISVNKDVPCATCGGKGVASDSKIISCKQCHGTGEITSVKNTILGQIRTSSICSSCEGEGQMPEKSCSVCYGKGTMRSVEQITIRIPAGVMDETTLRLSGKGGAGTRGSESGDFYVHIRVKPSSEFQRKGENISSQKTIHVLQAILGDEIEVSTVHGPVKLEIPPGTQSGQMFRIKGKGAKKLNSSVLGDHYITLSVEVPQKLHGKEREYYEELAKLAKLETKNKDKSFFSKLFS